MHYFFKKPDGEIHACKEKHADIYYGDHEYLGAVADSVVKKIHRNSGSKQEEVERELDELYSREEKIQENRDRLLTEEFLAEDDPKVKRAERRLEELHEKIHKKSEELEKLRGKQFEYIQEKALKHADTSITPPDRQYRAQTKDGRWVIGEEAKQAMKNAG